MSTYSRGRAAEFAFAMYLKNQRGFRKVQMSRGSRTPCDVIGITPKGERIYYQVKSGTAHAGREARRRLHYFALRKKAKAKIVHADRIRGKWIFSEKVITEEVRIPKGQFFTPRPSRR